ncbi:MAG TPA: histidine--tRNA ligase [Chloroflexota bacterium]|nr:histidine--tRNA ligase [Chloroflexota bacterium]HZU04441.1 histidine--tRNA ligase [Chloroflexota bacterium]
MFVYQAPRGTQDVLPEEAAYWTYVEQTARALAAVYGYGEIRTPTFEDTGLFVRGVGGGTDIVEKEMYSFRDKSGGDLTLRPEGTAPIIRAYLEHGMASRPQPVRLHSFVNCFRYDRPQRGRYREFHQWDCEAIGELDPLVDAELITLLWRFYERLGLRGLTLQLNSIGDARCRPAYLEALRAYYQERVGELCPDCRRRLETNPLRLLDCKNPTCQPAIAGAPRLLDWLCDECATHFAALRRYLDEVGIPQELNPRLVRGLDYYTKTVFEVWPPEVGAQAALGGGGRYDGLVEALGGRPTPAVGFATGIERIIMNLKQQGVPVPAAPAPRVYLAHLGEAAGREAVRLADALRQQGVPTVLAVGSRQLKAQLRQANSLGVAWVVILGEEELAAGEATVRDMASGTQVRVPLGTVVARLVAEG